MASIFSGRAMSQGWPAGPRPRRLFLKLPSQQSGCLPFPPVLRAAPAPGLHPGARRLTIGRAFYLPRIADVFVSQAKLSVVVDSIVEDGYQADRPGRSRRAAALTGR